MRLGRFGTRTGSRSLFSADVTGENPRTGGFSTASPFRPDRFGQTLLPGFGAAVRLARQLATGLGGNSAEIFARSSAVGFQAVAASAFCTICSGLVAPAITLVSPG